jgi:hypothetical protein
VHDGHGVNTRGTCLRDTLDLANGPGRAETRLRLPWRDHGAVRDRVSSSTLPHISQSSFSLHPTPPRCFPPPPPDPPPSPPNPLSPPRNLPSNPSTNPKSLQSPPLVVAANPNRRTLCVRRGRMSDP